MAAWTKTWLVSQNIAPANIQTDIATQIAAGWYFVDIVAGTTVGNVHIIYNKLTLA